MKKSAASSQQQFKRNISIGLNSKGIFGQKLIPQPQNRKISLLNQFVPPSQFSNVEEAKFPNYLLKTPPTNITTLSNGMRVATEETNGNIATVAVYIQSGSRYENPQNNGVAHFLEHMSFKVNI